MIAILFLVFIERVMNPFTDQVQVFPYWFTVAFTLLWIMGMINTVNFMDGLDGLATGVAAIVSAVLAIHMLREGQHSVALLPLALLGATLGFLPFNFHPARVFMGSSGALVLGYAIATLGIAAGAKLALVLAGTEHPDRGRGLADDQPAAGQAVDLARPTTTCTTGCSTWAKPAAGGGAVLCLLCHTGGGSAAGQSSRLLKLECWWAWGWRRSCS